MPFDRPTLPELIDQGAAEFESRLPGVLVRLRRSLIGVINRVLAGALFSLYLYVEWLNRQVWPDQADDLSEHGARWGVHRTPAAPATGTVAFTGTDGAQIPAGTILQRSDGARFLTDDAIAIVGGAGSVPVTAEVAGQAGNGDLGTALQLASPIAGVNSAAVTLTALSGGADVEDVEAWRSRLLARIRRAPQGGSIDDYAAWALEVPGVTRVWVSPGELGAGTVSVRFARDNDASPIPDAGEVATMQAHLDERRPVTAAVYVVAPVAAPLDFTIQLIPDTAAVRAAVEAELREVIRRDGAPGGTLLISRLREAISIAADEQDHVLVSPVANVALAAGELATMGAITWQQ